MPDGRRAPLWALVLALLLASPAPAAAVTYLFATPIAGDSVEVALTLADAPGATAWT